MLTKSFMRRLNDEKRYGEINKKNYYEEVEKLVKQMPGVSYTQINDQLNWITKCILTEREKDGTFKMGKSRTGRGATIWFSDKNAEYHGVTGSTNGNNILLRAYQHKTGYQLNYLEECHIGGTYSRDSKMNVRVSTDGHDMIGFMGETFGKVVKLIADHLNVYYNFVQDLQTSEQDKNVVKKDTDFKIIHYDDKYNLYEEHITYFSTQYTVPSMRRDGHITNNIGNKTINAKAYNRDGNWTDYSSKQVMNLLNHGLKQCRKQYKKIEKKINQTYKSVSDIYLKNGYGKYVAAQSILKTKPEEY